ncbi:YciI family protein [Shewanella sp. WXL01]|uniref:YciI family protein n=1 Tax=Shewanella sp. WXL01 TaxID=2709721 RepID=UPI001FD9F1C1|nr:YciI family protein [Shewanella sp. WXL01]
MKLAFRSSKPHCSVNLFNMHARKLAFSLLAVALTVPVCLSQQAMANPDYVEHKAKSVGADEYGMKRYVMAFLRKGPSRDRPKHEADELQAAHMANISRLAEEGKLVLAGPFFGDGELRGIYIFDVETVAEAKALTATDPAIKAGSLSMELVPWYGSAALMEINELHKQVAKTLF